MNRRALTWLAGMAGAVVFAAELAEAATASSHPLPVARTGRPGFTRLPPEQTGLAFTNRLGEELALTNTIVNNGSGLALGDVDGDGRCDVYVCTLEGTNALFRNLGDWRFTNIAAAAGVALSRSLSTGALFGDVEGDGDLDLLVNSIGGGTRLFVNDGRGHFAEKLDSGLSRRFGSTSMALADIDGDGDLDLYVANYRTSTIMDEPGVRFTLARTNGQYVVTKVNGLPVTSADLQGRFFVGPTGSPREAGEPDILYLNDGLGRFMPRSWTDGTFMDEDGKPLTDAPRDWGLSVMFRDLNGDGAPDIYVCNDADSPDRIWMNEGQGRFRALPRLALRHTCLSSMGVDCADVNRDGFDDLFTLDMMARSRDKRQTQLEKSRPPYLAPGNIESRPQYSRNVLQVNRGDTTFAEVAFYGGLQAADWAWCPVFLDVDLDGYEDILIANGFHREVEDIDVADQIRASKAGRQVSPREELSMRAMFPRWETPNLILQNLGGLEFREVGQAWGFDWVGVSQGMALGDLDNDGDLDVVLNNLNGAAGLYRNETSAGRVGVRLKGQGANTRGIGARVELRGGAVARQAQEIQAGGRYLGGDEAMRVFASGEAKGGMELEVKWRSGRRSVVTGVEANRIYEVDEAQAPEAAPPPPTPVTALFEDVSARLGHRHQEEVFDDFERQPLLSRRLSQLGPGVAWLDLNGDGWEDLVVGSGRGGTLGVMVNNRQGAFGRLNLPALQDRAEDDQTGVVGWMAERGHSTVLVGMANYESGQGGGVQQVEVFFGNVEKAQAVGPAEGSVGPLAVSDIDADGSLELFVGSRVVGGKYPVSAESRLFQLQEGRWVLDGDWTQAVEGAGMVSGAIWTDLAGDGYADLVLGCEWGPVRVYRNQSGRLSGWDAPVQWVGRPEVKRLGDLTGWWTGLSAGDLDGDGRMDLVVGNWGLNNRYREYLRPNATLGLWHGDVDGNGTWEVMETHEDGGREVPWQDWKAMKAAVPLLGEKFGSYADYAKAGLGEIFGEGLKQMQALRVGVLESVVLLNRGDFFEVRALPMEAQWAPVFGVNVGDADGDGREDVYLGQNFFATEAELGRSDAGRGLWLRGDGKGGLAVLSGAESGVKVYGEQRGSALGDYDGDGRVDLVTTQNGGETRLYRNVGGKAGLRVRLVGDGGNGAGLGAVVRVGREGSWGPAREVHGGGGYWSQDSAVQVLARPEGAGEVLVRWPGGKTTRTPVSPGAREIEIKADGSTEAR